MGRPLVNMRSREIISRQFKSTETRDLEVHILLQMTERMCEKGEKGENSGGYSQTRDLQQTLQLKTQQLDFTLYYIILDLSQMGILRSN